MGQEGGVFFVAPSGSICSLGGQEVGVLFSTPSGSIFSFRCHLPVDVSGVFIKYYLTFLVGVVLV